MDKLSRHSIDSVVDSVVDRKTQNVNTMINIKNVVPEFREFASVLSVNYRKLKRVIHFSRQDRKLALLTNPVECTLKIVDMTACLVTLKSIGKLTR